MEDKIQTILLGMGKAIAGGLPIEQEIASQLRKDYEKLYNDAGKPFGDSLEGLYQYIINTKVVIEGEE